MAITVTIGGATKSYRKGSLRVSEVINGRTTGSLSVRSNDGTYRPALDAEVIVTEGATRILGGLIDKPSERGILGDKTGAYPAIETKINVVDFSHYAERRYVNETLAAGTMKSMLTTLIANYLTDYGITLDGGQADGPSLPELKYEYRLLSEVLNEIATLTGKYGEPYVWQVDYFKVLSAFQPSTEAAPFDVADGDGVVIGDLTVETSNEKYANKVTVKSPAKAESGRIETFTGDGTSGPFTLQYTPTKLYGHILVTSGGGETLGLSGDGGQWSYDDVTNSITRDAGATAIGETYPLYFDGIYEGEASATDASWDSTPASRKHKVIKVETVPADTTIQALADAYLAQALNAPKKIVYTTFESGIRPGQTQHITSTLRDLDDDVFISEVVTRDYGKDRLVRTVSATTGDDPQDGWRDKYKVWSGDKTGLGVMPAVVAGDGGAVGIGPALPKRSIQYHDNENPGKFGGQAEFIFYQDEQSIVCGSDSAITAAAFSHCAIFGEFCEIADPA